MIILALKIPLPPILEPISWIIGRWETETLAGDRFPISFEHPYKEILDISLTDVPMFDRPPVNVFHLQETTKKKDENLFSIRAYTKEGSEYNEVGFMTGKPFRELTGFQEYNKSLNGNDQVAIEMVSNTGTGHCSKIIFNIKTLYDMNFYFFISYITSAI
ncbi:unnamed protein product [Brugia timori]|uniref:DUF1794 domain-containing protein n=1 Tax=Brugia timori TaxID=42155 RepID=A0A0R3R5R4_9BILA|nr:unnamed protein product [Brugia timori]